MKLNLMLFKPDPIFDVTSMSIEQIINFTALDERIGIWI
jgi:hypothetical protein